MKLHTSKKLKVLAALTIMVFLISALTIGCGKKEQAAGEKAEPQKVYKWRAVSHQMKGTARYEKTVVTFCEMVKEASGGRLVIEPYGAGVLFPVTDSFDNVKNNVVQMSMVWSGYWAGKDPVFALAGNIPGDPITDFAEHYYRNAKLEPILAKVYEKYGLKYLGAFDYGAPEILMSNKPINTLADFKGKNIRTAGISATYYTKLGASGVSLSAPEIYSALQLGTVDAAEYNDWLVNGEMGLNEVTKYVIEPCLHQGAINGKDLVVNPQAWAELPDDLKAIVIACMDRAKYQSSIAYGAESKKAMLNWLKGGTKIIQLSEKDVVEGRRVAAELLKEYKQKSPECGEYINAYIQALQELGYNEYAQMLQ